VEGGQVKVIGIVGSPRHQGNTEFLVREALTAAKEAGAEEVEVVSLAGKTILPCDGCDCCLETGECIIDDDMQEIYPKLLAADGIIMGTPVYIWGICGLAKVFIDRTYCLAASHLAIVPVPEVRAKMKNRGKDLRNKVGGILVVTARVGGTTALRQVSDWFRAARMIEAGAAIAFGYHKGEVSKDEQGLKEARWTGKAVVRAIKQRKALEG
jgi:multimeric flavodoxin WrbA